jgi:prepilin-type N-terminal cleavage/methylation domain-containing protein
MRPPFESAHGPGRGGVSPDASSHRRGPPAAPLRARGFTLLEVLVALTIFAMAAVMLASAYLNVLNSYEVVSRGVQINEDFAFARQQVLTEPDRKKVEEGGEFDTAGGRRARWTAEIESTNVADVFKVTFTCEVSDPMRPEPEKQIQSFVVLRPTWVIDAGERGKLKEDAKTRILELKAKQAGGQR